MKNNFASFLSPQKLCVQFRFQDYKYALKLAIDIKNSRHVPDFVELQDYAIQFQTSDGIWVPILPNL